MARSLHVLIVEDSENDTQLLLRELQRSGYGVEYERVQTRQEMEEALSRRTWNIILCDYTMPRFSAIDALATLKASGADTPFIIVSGTIDEETAVTALKEGANDFLVKGKFARLGPAIERELREAESRREHRRAEEQIKYHARLLRYINDAVIATDDQFRIRAWNRAAERIYGWKADEVMMRSVDEVLKAGLSREQQAEAQALLREKSSFRSERLHSKKNGQAVYVEENTIALTDEQGKITGYVSVNRDITERMHAEAQLREKEQLLSESQRMGHIGSWSYDIVQNSLQYSEEMYRLLDASPGKFPDNIESFLGLIYPLDETAAAQWMENIRSGRQSKELNFRILRKNGELRHIQCRGAVVFDSNGKPVRFTGMAQDITERKLAEIQIQQQIEQLSALRNIDQAIISNIDLYFTLNTILSEVSKQLQIDAAAILLLNADGTMLEYTAGRGFRMRSIETASVPVGESIAGRAARERRLIKIENLADQADDPHFATLLAEENFVFYCGVPLIAKGGIKGVLEVFHRVPVQPYPEWLDFLNILAGQAAIAIDNATLFSNLQATNQELVRAYDTTIEGWSRALDLRDRETEGHTQRVAELTLSLARSLDFPEEELIHIRRGALLHDIGKMAVPDNILLKPDSLTQEEWIIMRRHPQYAYELLKPIVFLAPSLAIPYCHHEKWDGTGYPRGLKSEEIPLIARLFAIVDVWDALTSDRPYRLAWSESDALTYIRGQSGNHFDPEVVDAFFRMS